MADTIEDEVVHRRYVISQKLGRGAYGVVWKATERGAGNGDAFAVKKCFDAFQSSVDGQRVFREIVLLLEFFGHENIVDLREVMVGEDGDDVYLVFTHMESDLKVAIQRNILQAIHQQFVVYQVCKALQYVHSAGVMHRDVKPENVLLDGFCRARLCDFGLARSFAAHAGLGQEELTDYVATRWYRAPEGLLKLLHYGEGFDIWGVGVILGEMIRGRPIFPGVSTVDQLDRVLSYIGWPTEADLVPVRSAFVDRLLESLPSTRGRPPPRPLLELVPSASPEALDLLRGCLQFSAGRRPAAAEALQHPYCAAVRDVGTERAAPRRLPLEPPARLTAREYRQKVEELAAAPRQRYAAPCAQVDVPAAPVAPAVPVAPVTPAPPAAQAQSLGPLSIAAWRVAGSSGADSMPQLGPVGNMVVLFNFCEAAVGLAHQLFVWADHNRNLRLERSEFLRLHGVFARLLDGGMGLGACLADGPDAALSAAAGDFAAVDVDRSGAVDEAEWMHYMAALFEVVGMARLLRLREALKLPNEASDAAALNAAAGAGGAFAFRPRPRVSFVECPMAVCQSHRLYQLAHGSQPGAAPLAAWAELESLVIRPEAAFFGLLPPASAGARSPDEDEEPTRHAPLPQWLTTPDEALWMAGMERIFERMGSHRFLKKVDQMLETLVVCADDGILSVSGSARSSVLSPFSGRIASMPRFG